jgi:hypothetical protein
MIRIIGRTLTQRNHTSCKLADTALAYLLSQWPCRIFDAAAYEALLSRSAAAAAAKDAAASFLSRPRRLSDHKT